MAPNAPSGGRRRATGPVRHGLAAALNRYQGQLAHRWRHARDRGATTSVIAALLGAGVLVGGGSLVVDVGKVFVERQELQSGADAAATALAVGCARAPATCGSQAARAQQAADDNASDHTSRVTTICGSGQGLPVCPPQPTNLTGCLGTPPTGSYVEVRTATRTADGSGVLPPAFARALSGNAASDGSTVDACARAVWGTPATGSGLSVTISTCAWNTVTANGSKVAAPPPATPAATAEGVIYLHSTHAGDTCAAGNSGWQAPGGFGWLDELAGPCRSTVAANGTYGGNTGVSASQACKSALATARSQRSVLIMPIFDGVSGNGAHTTYHLGGLSAFVLTGYALPGASAASTLTGSSYCHGSDKCLYGYFTTGLLTGSIATGGATSRYGVSVVALVG